MADRRLGKGGPGDNGVSMSNSHRGGGDALVHMVATKRPQRQVLEGSAQSLWHLSVNGRKTLPSVGAFIFRGRLSSGSQKRCDALCGL